MIYYKTLLSPYITLQPTLNSSDEDLEQLWVKIEKPGRKRLYVATIYRPPSGKMIKFLESLKCSINTVLSLHRNRPDLIILGDFNVDYSKSRHPDRRSLKILVDDSNMRQIINTPTRITYFCKSIIDLILTNIDPTNIMDSGVRNITISDHLPIFINVKKPKSKPQYNRSAIRSYKWYSYQNLKNCLEDNQAWRLFWVEHNTIDQCWNIMMNIIITSLDTICPIKEKTRRIDQHPWMDKELLKTISLKHRLHKQAINSRKSEENWHEFKEQCKIVNRLLVLKRRTYVMHTLADNRGDPKKFWKEISTNLKFGKQSNELSFVHVKDEYGNPMLGLDAANTLNLHYATVGSRLAEKFPPQIVAPGTAYDQQFFTYDKMVFRFVDVKEIKNLIKMLKNNKPSGQPLLKTTVLKDALDILIVEFTYLINRCLDTAYVPLEWKKGTITPIPKVSICITPSDYRPISVLAAASKVLERAVYNQVVYHLETNGLLDRRQHGFRRGHSTLSAIYDVVQYLYNSTDKGLVTYCAFIDYAKAFDTLDHEILLKKLLTYNISAHVISWCRNYLVNRKQQVKNGKDISAELKVEYGVPQGSILGPLFFIIYVNDLLTNFDNDDPKITLYADDTVLYVSSDTPMGACAELENGLSKLSHWCNKNKLSINVNKTKLMIVDLHNKAQHYPKPKLNGHFLDQVHSYNYLGVSIDDNILFDKFLREKYGKIHSRVYQLSRMRKYIDSNTASLVYKQMIVPLSDYADVLVKGGPANDISRLEKLHDRAVKIIDNKQHRNLSMNQLQDLYGLKSVTKRQDEHLYVLMYGLSKRLDQIEEHRPEIHLRGRNKVKFRKYKRTYEKYLKCPLARGVSLWDRLHEDVQKSTTKFKFKKCIQIILYQ